MPYDATTLSRPGIVSAISQQMHRDVRWIMHEALFLQQLSVPRYDPLCPVCSRANTMVLAHVGFTEFFLYNASAFP